mgnify:CR=1 FL=1
MFITQAIPGVYNPTSGDDVRVQRGTTDGMVIVSTIDSTGSLRFLVVPEAYLQTKADKK